jgi:hypothetical protein
MHALMSASVEETVHFLALHEVDEVSTTWHSLFTSSYYWKGKTISSVTSLHPDGSSEYTEFTPEPRSEHANARPREGLCVFLGHYG